VIIKLKHKQGMRTLANKPCKVRKEWALREEPVYPPHPPTCLPFHQDHTLAKLPQKQKKKPKQKTPNVQNLNSKHKQQTTLKWKQNQPNKTNTKKKKKQFKTLNPKHKQQRIEVHTSTCFLVALTTGVLWNWSFWQKEKDPLGLNDEMLLLLERLQDVWMGKV